MLALSTDSTGTSTPMAQINYTPLNGKSVCRTVWSLVASTEVQFALNADQECIDYRNVTATQATGVIVTALLQLSPDSFEYTQSHSFVIPNTAFSPLSRLLARRSRPWTYRHGLHRS